MGEFGLLAQAIELLGSPQGRRTLDFLKAMLRHENPVVRESAVMALEEAGHLAILLDHLDAETSPGVRAAIADAIMQDPLD